MAVRGAAAVFAALAAAAAPARADDLAFLGPRGTYSEQAAELYRSRTPGFETTVPIDTITHVVTSVRERKASRAILPAAATASGFPAESARAETSALDPGFRVVGEVNIPIDNDLMARPGASIAGLRTVLSHPNALGEAEHWLHGHLPDAKLVPTTSTAAAAEQVAAGDDSMAAVAGPAAAKLFKLTVLADRIQDNQDNRTSFWAIAPPGGKPEDHPDRIVVNIDQPPGARTLSTIVSGLQRVGFAVQQVHSAPLPGRIFGYRFTVTFAADHPLPLLRATDAIARDQRAGDGRALLIGAWRSAGE